MNNIPPKTPYERLAEQVTKAAANPTPVFEVAISMRDGIELAADVYLPVDSARPAPVIIESTPYDKSGFLADVRYFQERGYAYVIHDVRGRGKSEGEWRAFVNDGQDGYDVVEWAARQEWCNGKVGTSGISYMGWTQWAIAAERPPHLKCMVSTSAAGRWQQEIPYTWGVFQLYFGWWVFLVRRRISEIYRAATIDWDEVLRRLPLEAIGDFINPTGLTWRDMMDHDTLDDFWMKLRFDNRYAQMDIPCLHVTGWYDLEDLLGAFHHYEGMMKHSPLRDQQRLLVGPWSHLKSRRPHSSYAGIELGPQAALEMNEEHLRWFDYWLKGIDNGVLNDAPARLFETGTNVWRDYDRWPLDGREESMYLCFDGQDGSLAAQPAQETETARSYRYDPNDPAPTQMDVKKYPFEDVPLDQDPVEARSDVVAYTGVVLEEELVVSGWPHLDLFAASDCDDTDWHVKLTDVQPDGRSLKVAQGCLRASYRDSLQDPIPLVPGQVYRFDVELGPIHHAFLPGHRIRISVTSSDFPWFARSMNRFGHISTLANPRVATNSIHHSPTFPSRVRLPVVRGSVK